MSNPMGYQEKQELIKSQENERGLLTDKETGVVIEGPKKGAAAQDPLAHEADMKSMTEGFMFLQDGMNIIQQMGVPVPCPLPNYKGLTVYFRTGIKRKYYRDRPVFSPSPRVTQEQDRLNAID